MLKINPVNVLMASRLLTMYLMGVMYSIVVILPAVIVYWIAASFDQRSGSALLCMLALYLSIFASGNYNSQYLV